MSASGICTSLQMAGEVALALAKAETTAKEAALAAAAAAEEMVQCYQDPCPRPPQ